jgi:CHAT domain-containing protein
MEPVEQIIRSKGFESIYLVPCGNLAFLPLHACSEVASGDGTLDPRILDWSRIPSAFFLPSCRKHAADVTSIYDLVGIVNPQPSRLAPLQAAQDEMEVIAARFFTQEKSSIWFRPRILEGEGINTHILTSSLSGQYYQIAHFACHAMSDMTDTSRTGIRLSRDTLFGLRRLFNLRKTGFRLVVLSCCETGIPDLNHPDEAIDITGGFLYAGFPGVIASQWAVSEISTGMLIIRFYEEWLDRGHAPARALRLAQRWLRYTTNGEKAEYFAESSLPAYAQGLPEQTRDRVRSAWSRFYVSVASRPSNARQFEHPYFWAGFYYAGV